MLRDGDTQFARSPALLLRYAEHRGLDRGALMREASLTEQDLADPDKRVPVIAMHRLWRAVLEADTNPLAGLEVGQSIAVKEMGLVGYVMYYSDTLLNALLQLSRYSRLMSDAVQFRVTERENGIALQVATRPYMVALKHPIVAALALIITVARAITEVDVVPRSVRMPIAPPPDPEPYRSFFGRGISFESPLSEIRFSHEHMRLPVKANDPELSSYLDELADSKSRELSESGADFIDRVRREIWTNLQSGKPGLKSTARKIGLSPRTLQRRLEEYGTSFSAVLDELRQDISEELTKSRGFGVSEIAFLLGYSESSAYLRAIRRWRKAADRDRLAS